MPNVPSAQRQVQARPLPQQRIAPQQISGVTPDAFGASRALALADLSSTIFGMADTVQGFVDTAQEEDRVRGVNLEATALDDEFATILYGEDGFLQAQGENANAIAGAAARKALETVIRKRADSIGDQETKRRFRTYADNKLRQQINPMARYSAEQGKQSAEAIARVRQAQAIQEAVNGFRTDPQAIDNALDKGTSAIETNAIAQGLTTDVIDQQELAFIVALHTAVIEAYGQTYDVEGAQAYFNEVRDDIEPTQRDDVQKTIRSFETARRAEVARQRAAVTAARADAKQQIGDQFFGKLAANELTAAEVLGSNLPALGPGGKREWLRLINEGAAGKSVVNPQVYNELFDRIQLPEGDPNRLADADELNRFMGKGLTFPALAQLRGELQGKGTPEGQARNELRKSLFKTARNQISGTNELTGLRDPKGEELYQAWLADTLAEEARQRRAGKLTAESYNPTSQTYIGRNIGQYRRSLSDQLRDMNSALRGDTATVPSEADLTAKATRTGTLNGRRIFEVDGVWLFGDGTKAQP